MDLSCDYLIDITGLTDVPKEVYSCARQDGACENKNCPAAKNFEKKSSDYQTTMPATFWRPNDYGRKSDRAKRL